MGRINVLIAHTLMGHDRVELHDALNINKLAYDIAREETLSMVTIFNDTAGCYDIMWQGLMEINPRLMGCLRGVALCHTRALNKMKHVIKTKFGISDKYIQASAQLDLGVLSKGNGGGG